MLGEWAAISSDLLRLFGQDVWAPSWGVEGCWVELRERIASLLVLPVTADPSGRPVFMSTLQARLLGPRQ